MRKGTMRGRGKHSEAIAIEVGDDVVGEREASSSRARLLDVVPLAWLDQLLFATLELPLFRGERDVVESLVNSVAAILPSFAVGACVVPEPGATQGEPSIVKRLPPSTRERTTGADPTRIFPGLSYEHVVVLPGSSAGSTLHVASDDHELDPETSPAVHLVERAAMVLGRALQSARATEAARAGAKEGAAVVEQRMIHADKLATFGQVVAGVVHELNNPLTSIVAYSDYLIRKAVEFGGRDEDDVERLRRISESANRMLRFTRELVSYARPSSGPAVPVALHPVLDRAIAFCEHVLSAAGMRVERLYGPEVLTVRGVSEQLVQVFVNLITNACQAAPSADGRLIVTTSIGPSYDTSGRRRVLIVVEDNGTGIASEHMAQVFAPFFTTKDEKNGTGLGLSIVKSIVESHDGEIRVDSQLGRGTRFLIELPQKA